MNGLSIDDAPEAIKKIIGVQLQTAGFYPNLTLTELIILFVGLYQTEIDPLSLLKKVNLSDKANAKFKQLSVLVVNSHCHISVSKLIFTCNSLLN